MNKKLSLARRITGQVAAENVVAPLTGEILIDAGAKITREPGPVKGGTTVIAFVEDPDGYKIELIAKKDAGTGLGDSF